MNLELLSVFCYFGLVYCYIRIFEIFHGFLQEIWIPNLKNVDFNTKSDLATLEIDKLNKHGG